MAEKSDKKKKIVEDNSDDDGKNCEFSLEKQCLGPKKKLLILCLGGMLLHRVYRYDKQKIPKSRRPDGAYGSFFVYKRPLCDDFLKFCIARFKLGIWSSAREWYVDSALDCITKGLRPKLAFILDQESCTDSGFKALDNKDKPIYLKELNQLFDQESCTDSGFKALDNKDKPIYLKELNQLFESENRSLPWCKGQYSAKNTLMLENKPYKAMLNPPNTAIFLTEYHADDVNDTVLGPDGELRKYLDGVASADNVQTYVKEHPFGNPGISASHPDWHFYSMIIRSLQCE